MYAHVKEDGSVDYLGSLPKKWENVSGLHLSDGDDEYAAKMKERTLSNKKWWKFW